MVVKKIYYCSLKGERDTNEDVIHVKKSKKTGEILGAIYDGHGGDFVSSYLGKHLLKSLTHTRDSTSIQEKLYKIQSDLVRNHHKKASECGSTVLVCRISPKGNELQVVNLGDSRAIVIQKASKPRVLTQDHKPENPDERLRITQEGHKVYWDKQDEVYRVDGYSVSRGLGDLTARGLSREGDIRIHKLNDDAKYVVLACDGVWDVLTSQDVSTFIKEASKKQVKNNGTPIESGKNKNNLAFLLAKHALQQGSMDNTSILIFEV
jgi:serine/threonine protein phosphatase PrpC